VKLKNFEFCEHRTADCMLPSFEVALWALATLIVYFQYVYTFTINCSKALCEEIKEADRESKIMKGFFLSEGIAGTHFSS
jgi:hypothetical protein